MYRIYLDNCCFNRPYDDQAHLLVQLETQAKLYVQRAVLQGEFELVWSFILNYENSVNPHDNRKHSIAKWKNIATLNVMSSESIVKRTNEIMRKGIKSKDAMHIACALDAKCHYFLTTDKKLLNTPINKINIISPIDFLKIL